MCKQSDKSFHSYWIELVFFLYINTLETDNGRMKERSPTVKKVKFEIRCSVCDF